MSASALASAISIRPRVDRKNGQARYISRETARSSAVTSSPMIASTPSQDGRSSRVCVQANCQGIARSACRPPAVLRRAGRLPMWSASSSASGVAKRKYSPELRVVVDRAAIRRARDRRQPLHRLAPGGLGRRSRGERRVERGAGVHLQRPQRDAGQAELRVNHLPLLGDAKRAVHRSRRLRLDRDIGRDRRPCRRCRRGRERA